MTSDADDARAALRELHRMLSARHVYSVINERCKPSLDVYGGDGSPVTVRVVIGRTDDEYTWHRGAATRRVPIRRAPRAALMLSADVTSHRAVENP